MSYAVTNLESEIRAIASVCSLPDGDARALLLSRVTQRLLGHPDTASIMTRIATLLMNGKPVPSLRVLRVDPTLSDEARALLTGIDASEIVTSLEEAVSLVNVLEQYRRLRAYRDSSQKAFELLEQKGVAAFDKAMDIARLGLLDASDSSENDNFLRLGVGNNSTEMARRILTAKKPNLLPTGFRNFDSRYHGLDNSEILTIGAPPGGGKSVLATQLATNIAYEQGVDTIVVNYELPPDQYYERFLSNRSGIPYKRIREKETLTDDERRVIARARKSFEGGLIKRGVRFDIWNAQGLTMQQLLMRLTALKYGAMVIDYLGLVDSDPGSGRRGESQQEELGRLMKMFKQFLNANGGRGIIVVQVDETTKDVKYSKAIKAHTAFLWTWERQRNTERIDVIQKKNRTGEINGDDDTFALCLQTNIMRVTDWTEESAGRGSASGVSTKRKPSADLAGMMDEDGEVEI